MQTAINRTFICSVVFLDMVEYSKKPVAEQIFFKERLNTLLTEALANVAPNDRIILDTGDGAALSFLGDPEDALYVSLALREALEGPQPPGPELKMRLGINLGPVRLVKDINGQPNIIGDGINVAQRVMSFSSPGQLLVSRSFYEVVSCLSRDYASLFRHEGSRTDKHVRAHEVYAVVGATPAPRRVDEAEARTESLPPGAARWFSGTGVLGLRRTALIAAPLLFLVIVAGGVGARAMLPEPPPMAEPPRVAPRPVAKAPAAAAPAPAAAAPAPAPAAGGGAGVIEEAPKKKLIVARVEKKLAEKPKIEKAGAPGRLELAIAPWGEVLVDGKSRGISPPLRVLELPPGAHTVEIRNSTFPAHVARVEVKGGESVRVQHRFR